MKGDRENGLIGYLVMVFLLVATVAALVGLMSVFIWLLTEVVR